MSELAGINLLATQVAAATGFASTNVTVMKWKILNDGVSDHYAILKPGTTTRTALTFTVKDNVYQTIVEVWQQYVDDGTSGTNLMTHVDNITTRLDRYRKLADTTSAIRDANVIGYGEVKEQWTKDGGPAWLSRDVIVEWQEEEAVSYAE
jgi:hypothetical protein